MSYLLALALLLLATPAWADTHTAASCSRANVLTAYNAASDGDIVALPTCASTTWSSDFTITKGITLQGNGVGNTNLNISGVSIILDTTLGKTYRITGITFTGTGAPDGNGMIKVQGDSHAWRVDNCETNSVSSFIRGGGATYGLIDNNTFNQCDMCIRPGHAEWGGGEWGNSSWTDDLYFGTEKAIYIEDNTFNGVTSGGAPDSPFDCEGGGRIVFRYNTVNDAFLINHGTDSSGYLRSCFSMEIYENTIVNDDIYFFTAMQFRGGTAVIYNNSLTGGENDHFCNFYNRRQTGDSPWGACNGTKSFDGNVTGGYPCLDQVGRSTGGFLDGPEDSWPNQALEPVYCWGNTGSPTDCYTTSGDIVVDRDLYTNTQRPGYSAYTYPHPLRGGGGPAPPKNVMIRRGG